MEEEASRRRPSILEMEDRDEEEAEAGEGSSGGDATGRAKAGAGEAASRGDVTVQVKEPGSGSEYGSEAEDSVGEYDVDEEWDDADEENAARGRGRRTTELQIQTAAVMSAYTGRRRKHTQKKTVKKVVIKRNPWLSAPLLKQDWHEEQHHHTAHADELFFDLVLVAVTIQLTAFIVSRGPGAGTLGMCVAYVLVFWNVWIELAVLYTRFLAEDVFHKVTVLVHLGGVMCMGVHTQDGLEGRFGFAVGYAVTHAALVAIYVRIALMVPRAAKLAQVLAVGFAVSLAPILLSAVVPEPQAAPYLWVVAALVTYGTGALTFRLSHVRLPVNVAHFAERHGLYVTLNLGESIIVLATATERLDSDHYLVVFLGFVLVFSVQLLYYETQPDAPGDHALRASIERGRFFVSSHFFLILSLIGIGAGLKLLLKHANDPFVRKSDALLLCYSVVVCLFFLNMVRLTHPFKVRRRRVWLSRLALTAVGALLPLFNEELNAQGLISILCMITFTMAAIDLFNSEVVMIEVTEDVAPEPVSPGSILFPM